MVVTYHIWTVGCQMNKADSDHLSRQLEARGLQPRERLEEADLIVLNSCVVRQHAEDRVAHRLQSLKGLKKRRPPAIIALVGCMVGPKTGELQRRFPQVDVFCRPEAFDPLLRYVARRTDLHREGPHLRPIASLGEFTAAPAPVSRPGQVCAFVPIIHGCDKFCTFCIVPYRRGREKSRPIPEVVAEVEELAAQGVKEVTLLGQTVDSYGHDLPDHPDLADLLEAVNAMPGLERIRFLTSYPKDMTERIIAAVAELPKVCEYFNLPVQSGDNAILAAMHRGYTVEDYCRLVERIRQRVPKVSLSTDVIVGFPGETEAQFQRTYDLLEALRFDAVHVAAYSPRPDTIAWRTLPDDVPSEEKKGRLQALEALQERISRDINGELVGREVEVLVEGAKNGSTRLAAGGSAEASAGGKWQGRTRTNRLVFFPREPFQELRGALVNVRIETASPWTLQGRPRPSQGA